MAKHKKYPVRSKVLAVIAFLGVVLLIPQISLAHPPTPPKSLRLYVLDCGKLRVDDPGPNYGFTKDQLVTTDLSVPCFLIVHPKGTLMWDTGVLPDSVFNSGPGPIVQGRATVYKSLRSQLAEIGYTPGDIKYLAMSHYHWDHTANANDFAGATWIVEKNDYDVMFTDPPPSKATIPSYFSSLKNNKPVILTGNDYDVFGDGTVIIKSAPGHTEGHQVLFVKLAKTGPILLTGDLYHYPEERTQGHVPKGEWNRDETAASRASIEEFLKKTGAQLWIQHDFTANAKLRKSPQFYE
jgi:N-acyl homoserine lactone hydrolase